MHERPPAPTVPPQPPHESADAHEASPAGGADARVDARLLPLLRAIEHALDVPTTRDDAARARLGALAADIVRVLTTEMTPNFWRPNRQFAQDPMGASIFRHMLRAGFAATAETEERVERILVFTKANYALFGR